MKRNKKKLNNKGFSLVELIIVIAIMAILSGALAPQLIKYLDKSRKAADVQAAQTIATAVNTALTNEDAFTAAANMTLSELYAKPDTDKFAKAVKEVLGGTTSPTPKYKTGGYVDFYIDFNASKEFTVSASKSNVTASITLDEKDVMYPKVGDNFK